MTPRPVDSPHPNPSPEGEGLKETKAVAGWVLDQILVMLHPFMPFVTEELWHSMGARPYELIVAKWPEPGAAVDAEAKREVEWMISLITTIRSGRTELNVPPGLKPEIFFSSSQCSGVAKDWLGANRAAIERLARVRFRGLRPFPGDESRSDQAWDDIAVETLDDMQRGSLSISADGFEGYLPLEGVIDIAAEKARLEKALAASQKEAKSLEGRLANPAFVEKAAPQAVDKARADHDHHAAEAERLAAARARLG